MTDMSPDDHARLFYLSILGMAFLVAAFSYYRGRLGAALQHGAIWGLLFVGLIIAYGFRDVLERELSASPLVEIADDAIILRRGGDGHFHAPLVINGARIDALVDTGATALVLSRADAARADIDTGALVYSSPAYSANGVVYSAPVTLDQVRLGPFEDRFVPAMVGGGDMNVTLLGMRYLDRYSRFSFEGDRLVLER
jgi:aspartyl protease family protein